MPALEPFHPDIDRYDQRSAGRLFESLWQDETVSRAVAERLAASVRVAHAAGDACWEVTMYPHGIRLNVGQVETMTVMEEDARFLVRAPLNLAADPRFKIDASRSPVYPAVPVPSAVCECTPSDVAALPTAVRLAHEEFVRAAASFKQGSPFKRSHSPAVLDYVEGALSITLPRPSYAPRGSPDQQVNPLADELDPSQPLMEGARYQVTVNAYERDPRARQLCIAAYGTSCVVCGFSFGAVYGREFAGIVHVHHCRPLSEAGGEREVDPVEDLRPVCPNCHAVIHHGGRVREIAEVQRLLAAAGPNGPATTSEPRPPKEEKEQ
jgi:hypothetical protein